MNKLLARLSQFDAPTIAGYYHIDNTPNEDPERAKQYYIDHPPYDAQLPIEVLVKPFFPTGKPGENLDELHLDKYKIRWAIYYKISQVVAET